MVQRVAGENPAGVRPPSTIMRSVRIAFAIRKLVMHAMGGHPEDRSAFKRQRAADGKKVLQPLGRPVAAMRQQSVVAHADAHIDRHDPKPHEAEEGFPGEHEECHHGEHMERHHEAGGHPIRLIRLGVSAKHWYVAVWLHVPRFAGPAVPGYGRRSYG